MTFTMAFRSPYPVRPTFGGLTGPPAPHIVALLVVLFATYSLQFFAATAWLPAFMRLTPAVWQQGFVWQLASYPFAGYGPPSLWFLLELLIIFMFGNQVYWRLGRRTFWRVLMVVTVLAAGLAIFVALLAGAGPTAFTIMQGQRMVLIILIAAFATAFGDSTILFFFVLPLKARWFLWIEVAVAFIAFLSTRDLPGFAGVCAAVVATFAVLSGPGQWRRIRLQWERFWLQLRLRRRPRLRLVDRDGPKRWLH